MTKDKNNEFDDLEDSVDIVSKNPIFAKIEESMEEVYNDFTILNASLATSENNNSAYIFIDGILVALVDISPIDDTKNIAFLNFHVATLPNVAIKLYNTIVKSIDFPVFSSSVFYPVNSRDKATSDIYYNKKAIDFYKRDLGEVLYKNRLKHEKMLEDLEISRSEFN